LESGPPAGQGGKKNSLPIAWARDRAFNFYYADNLELLEDLGAELIPFSPLEDAHLPAGVRGVWLGGGFPEVFAPALSQNHSLLQQLLHQIPQGLPVYAECGGFMYLCKGLTDTQGQIHPMVGVIPHTCGWSSTLTLGYRQAIVQTQKGFLAPGGKLRGHEFHRSQILASDGALPKNSIFYLQGLGANSPIYPEGWWGYRCHGSYLHLHFGELLALPQGFLKACGNFAPLSVPRSR
jgi:cobyrinic acid a,c-diamide synthase